MKNNNASFDDYIEKNDSVSLHPNLSKIYKRFPDSIHELKNMIFYGPKGVGKYTQVLSAIKKYSPSGLKYEKKISVTLNKNIYIFKISDIHFEIDMSLLGCNTKLLWNELYNHVVDVILAKTDTTGIIVCKYFHETHAELLDSFYSYMQSASTGGVHLVFILITEAVSFIPDNIVNSCYVLDVSRPSRASYNRCLDKPLTKNVTLSEIVNMKHITHINEPLTSPHRITCDIIVKMIINIKEIKFMTLREHLYDIFIYDLDVNECTWYIIKKLITEGHLKHEHISNTLLRVYKFFRYYNNNYRPIYHLEGLVFYLINKIHGFDTCVQYTQHQTTI